MFGASSWQMWALLSAIFAAATALLGKAGVSGVDSHLATAIRTVVVLVFAWAIVFALGATKGIGELTSRNWWLLGLSGLATGASWLCYFRALQLGPVSRVAPIDKLSVVFAVLGAAVLFGEKLTLNTLAGVAMITVGALLLIR